MCGPCRPFTVVVIVTSMLSTIKVIVASASASIVDARANKSRCPCCCRHWAARCAVVSTTSVVYCKWTIVTAIDATDEWNNPWNTCWVLEGNLHLEIDQSVSPVQLPPRHQPTLIKDRINAKSEEICRNGIPEKVTADSMDFGCARRTEAEWKYKNLHRSKTFKFSIETERLPKTDNWWCSNKFNQRKGFQYRWRHSTVYIIAFWQWIGSFSNFQDAIGPVSLAQAKPRPGTEPRNFLVQDAPMNWRFERYISALQTTLSFLDVVRC